MSAEDQDDRDESVDESLSSSDSDESSETSMEDEIDFTEHMHENAEEELEDRQETPRYTTPNLCTNCGVALTGTGRINVYEARDQLIPAYQVEFFVFCDYRCLIRYAAKFRPSVSSSS
jgi:hypothetical protein